MKSPQKAQIIPYKIKLLATCKKDKRSFNNSHILRFIYFISFAFDAVYMPKMS